MSWLQQPSSFAVVCQHANLLAPKRRPPRTAITERVGKWLNTQVQCVECGDVRTADRGQSATHVMLYLGDGNNDTAQTSLQGLLDARDAAEAMDGSHHCTRCSKRTSVQKVTLVRKVCRRPSA